MRRSGLNLNNMKSLLYLFTALSLAGCTVPKDDKSFITEKSPAVSAIAGEDSTDGKLTEQIREANEKNQRRLQEGDWRAIQPAVGPKP
jgi:hypothetical protein